MKIIMGTDVEGCSGVVSFDEQGAKDGRYYEQTKKLLTGEVNAAVDGLLAAGAEEVLVMDGHGVGGICFEDLHPQAKLLHGRPYRYDVLRENVLPRYDAAVMIGQHARIGAKQACLQHTQNHVAYQAYLINGQPVGEIAQFGLHLGVFDIPIFYLSGDKAAAEEAEGTIDGIMTTVVKEGLSTTSAISLSLTEARRRIREDAEKALEAHKKKPVAPLKWDGPYVLEKRYRTEEQADAAMGAAHRWERVDDHTLRLTGDHILDILYA
jgi:D-amino peptidase